MSMHRNFRVVPPQSGQATTYPDCAAHRDDVATVVAGGACPAFIPSSGRGEQDRRDDPGSASTRPATVIGCGRELSRQKPLLYLGRQDFISSAEKKKALQYLNQRRDNSRGAAVIVTYYYEIITSEPPLKALVRAAKMILEHGTIKPWEKEGSDSPAKPAFYDEYMSWIKDIRLLGYNGKEGLECGLIKIAYPLILFDKRGDKFPPFAQMMEIIAGEAMYAFSFYQGAKIVDIDLPPSLIKKFPGQIWPHKRIRQYLRLKPDEPIIGTIVKPKTGLTPEIFSRCVVEAAKNGAHFTKADENMHLTLKEIPVFVGRVTKDLKSAGFDLGRGAGNRGKRFIFAPHITADADNIMDYAGAAAVAGANALMFSPYYGGGFLKMAQIIKKYDIPVYAHTAGMNVYSGSAHWGISASINYLFSALFGAAFMQITTVGEYLKPLDGEKAGILAILHKYGLDGDNGMTLAIAGGMGPKNAGENLKAIGEQGRMLLAGSSVYGHPDGPAGGVKALITAHRAYKERKITRLNELISYGRELGQDGLALLRAIE